MMTPPVSPLRRRFALFVAFLWMTAIFVGSSTRPPAALVNLSLPDWLLHGVEYGILGFLVSRYLLLKTRWATIAALIIVPAFFALLYGITDEIHQSFVPGRTPDVLDALADLAGGFTGGLVYYVGVRIWSGRVVAGAAVLLALAGAVRGAPADDPVGRAAAAVDAAGLKATADFLASDALRGREAPSPSIDCAARYLAVRFEALGLRPGAKDGGWFQTVPMRFRRDDGASLVRVLGASGGREFTGEDVAVLRESPDGLAAGPLVFAGYGIGAPELGRDDYAGVDVRGSTVLVFAGLPRGKGRFDHPRDRAVLALGTVRAKAAAAARHGAVGLAIAVPPLADRVDRLDLRDGTVREGTLTKVAGGYRLRERDVRRIPVAADEVDRVVLKDGTVVTLRRGAGGAPIELPAAAVDRFYPHDAVRSVETGVTPLPVSDLGEGWLPGGKPPEGPLPVVAVSDPVVREMLPGNDLDALESRVDAGPGSFRIAERVVVIRVKTAVETRPTRNVLAVLPGARKPGRYVVVSAHYDHLGIDRSGEVMNGADDNASGTSALLAVARAFRDLGRAPDRSVLFLALTAEERGLVGSRQFVRDPPVPLDSILAELNMDMVGRGVADELDVFAGPLGTNLGDLLEASASAAGIRGDFEIVGPPDGVVPPPVGRAALDLPVPKTRSNLFGRSDHATFYRKGIPAAFLFGGLNPDYHRPTDTPDKLNPEKMARVARMVFRCALGIADGGLSPAKEDPPR